MLRYALIYSAHNVVKNNATFKMYYDRKMAEGRKLYNTLGHCADKLIRVIWKMMTDVYGDESRVYRREIHHV